MTNLGHFRIEKGDEGEGPERLRDEDVGDLTELSEVVLQVVGRDVLGAATHEHLARDQGLAPLLEYKTALKFSL